MTTYWLNQDVHKPIEDKRVRILYVFVRGMYDVHCVSTHGYMYIYNVRRTSVRRTMYDVRSYITIYDIFRIIDVDSLHIYTMYTVRRTVYGVHRTPNSVRRTLYTVRRTMYG